MTERSLLGAAALSDRELAVMASRALGADPEALRVTDVVVRTVDYDIPSITTAGRYWVDLEVQAPAGDVRLRCFVKHVHSWSRSPLFASVPPEHRAAAADAVPWATEPLLYERDLGVRLPAGLRVPRCFGVYHLDDISAAMWIEAVPAVAKPWTVADLAEAAVLLGRLAASPAVAELGGIGEQERTYTVRDYVETRGAMQVIPLLRHDEVWRHPLVAGAFDDQLRERLVASIDRLPGYLDELDTVPLGTAHGDACPNNLLRVADSDDLVLIDFGFWGTKPIGFDLNQLLVGEVQLGRAPAAQLPTAETACLAAYIQGLRAEGLTVEPAVVARSHALTMLIYSGLTTVPFELLDAPITPELEAIALERAAIARFCLDLVDRTAPSP